MPAEMLKTARWVTVGGAAAGWSGELVFSEQQQKGVVLMVVFGKITGPCTKGGLRSARKMPENVSVGAQNCQVGNAALLSRVVGRAWQFGGQQQKQDTLVVAFEDALDNHVIQHTRLGCVSSGAPNCQLGVVGQQ